MRTVNASSVRNYAVNACKVRVLVLFVTERPQSLAQIATSLLIAEMESSIPTKYATMVTTTDSTDAL